MKKAVCVIDDDDDIRDVMIYALESEGYVVVAHTNGKKALDSLKKLQPDQYPGLIISDYLMPEMDGVAFINHVKTHFPETIGAVPFALSSATGAMPEEVSLPKDVIMMGKPVELDELLRVVQKFCDPSAL